MEHGSETVAVQEVKDLKELVEDAEAEEANVKTEEGEPKKLVMIVLCGVSPGSALDWPLLMTLSALDTSLRQV